MGASTGREIDRYWRRRAVSLVGVLGVLGVFAWACTGDAEPVRDAGAVTSPPPAPTAMPTVTVTATATPEPEAGGTCDEDDVVVTMSVVEKTYSGAERPEFRVTVVNTAKGWCTFDTGSLDVRIKSGSDAIWSSAECRRGGASKKILERGVPYIRTVSWDRKRGCGEGHARPGTYVADLKGRKEVFHLR